MKAAHCSSCGERRWFRHLHDTAHGIAGTHMAGSERFQCSVCGETYYAKDGAPFPLKFIFDECPSLPPPPPLNGEDR